MTSYSRSRKNKAHAQRDSLGRTPPSSASRGRKRTPAAHGRSRVRLKRVLLNAYSMAELESWIKHHRNPGGFVCLELARNPKCGFENVYSLAIAIRMRLRMKDKPRGNLNKNYFILTSKNLTYYEGKTGEVLYHWTIHGWLDEKLLFERVVYSKARTDPKG